MRTRNAGAGQDRPSSLSPSRNTRGSCTSSARALRAGSSRPTAPIASANTFALPSSTGISGPSTWISALSTPQPSSAESRCSTVEIAVLADPDDRRSRGVDHVVGASRETSTAPLTRKRSPWPAGAGRTPDACRGAGMEAGAFANSIGMSRNVVWYCKLQWFAGRSLLEIVDPGLVQEFRKASNRTPGAAARRDGSAPGDR